MRLSFILVAFAAFNCAQGNPGGPSALPAPIHGGALDPRTLPKGSVTRHGDSLSVWGTTEVPRTARLQVALAGLDAIVRAEFLKLLEVNVSTAMMDIENDRRQQIVVETSESVLGALPGYAPIEKGWVEGMRSGNPVWLLAGKMTVQYTDVAKTLAANPSLAPHAEVILTSLFRSESQ